MLVWTTAQVTLRATPSIFAKAIAVVPLKTVLELTGKKATSMYKGNELLWLEAKYNTGTKVYTGLAYSGCLEEYEQFLPGNVVEIANQTIDPNDHDQDIVMFGRTYYNMCGPIAVCSILNIPLKQLVERMGIRQQPLYKRLWVGRDNGTDISDLQIFLQEFGRQSKSLAVALTDVVLERPLMTPRRLRELLNYGEIIIAVKIDTYGDVAASGALHWVVVKSVNPDGRDDGYVTIFNPSPNRDQTLKWREFKKSAGTPYGVFVMKNAEAK